MHLPGTSPVKSHSLFRGTHCANVATSEATKKAATKAIVEKIMARKEDEAARLEISLEVSAVGNRHTDSQV